MCLIPVNVIQGLKDCPQLYNICDDCAKQGIPIPDLTAKEPVSTSILSPEQYLEQERQGKIPRMANHNIMKYIAENLQDTSTQVISLKFDDFGISLSKQQQQATETVAVSTQTELDSSLRVSADTLTAFTIAIIQDTHNAVYDDMRTYYQTAHNQATLKMLQRMHQLMNSHYNIALLADFEQVVNASPNTKSQPASDYWNKHRPDQA